MDKASRLQMFADFNRYNELKAKLELAETWLAQNTQHPKYDEAIIRKKAIQSEVDQLYIKLFI